MLFTTQTIRYLFVAWIINLAVSSAVADDEFRVTLLGTGAPIPRIDRFGPSTLVEVAGQRLLFDVGRGATQRLMQLGIPFRDIDAVFLTHFHSDHVSGLPDLWMTGWLPPPFGRRSEPFEVWGPTGTGKLLDHLGLAFEANTRIRIPDELLPPAGIELLAHEFDMDGVVYEKAGVHVTAFTVDHGDLIKPAYGYRVDYEDRAVVISGDTHFDENLIAAARGADLIIHEVVLASDEVLESSERFRRIFSHHTAPEQAGVVFRQVRPKLAVYTHIVILGEFEPTTPMEALKNLITRTRKSYDGPLVVGEDLMSFIIDDEVTMVPEIP